MYQKVDFRKEQNNNTSSHMLLECCYAFGLLLWSSNLKKMFFEEGDPLDLFLPSPGYAPGRIWPKCLTHVRSHEFFIPTKFCKHPSSGSVVKADYLFPYIQMH